MHDDEIFTDSYIVIYRQRYIQIQHAFLHTQRKTQAHALIRHKGFRKTKQHYKKRHQNDRQKVATTPITKEIDESRKKALVKLKSKNNFYLFMIVG